MPQQKLSPLNADRFRTLLLLAGGSDAPDLVKPRQRAERAWGWHCPICGDFHEDEDDAEDCCQGPEPETKSNVPLDVACPVCGAMHPEHRVAVDCCLWKDLDAPTRWALADRVEAGISTWADELEALA